MANYVLTFRAPKGSVPAAGDDARWPAWLAGIGGQITDPGNGIGQVRSVGGAPDRPDVLAGYIVISAGSLDAAAAVAEGCPMLLQADSVEVGEVIPAGPAS